jgi:hypothetical protein
VRRDRQEQAQGRVEQMGKSMKEGQVEAFAHTKREGEHVAK